MLFDTSKRFSRRTAICIALLWCVISPAFLSAQDSLNVRFIGCYPCGQYWFDPIQYMPKQAAIVGARIDGHAYIFATAGTGVVIFNVDDPTNPERVSHVSSPIDLYPFVVDNLLYVTAIDRGLKIYNVADPMNPVEIGSCACSEWMWSVYVKDSVAYATGPNQLTIFNVSDPSAPFISGTWTPALSSTSLRYVFVQGQYAYITAEQADPWFEGILFILDVQDPSSPALVGSCMDLGNVRKLRLKDDYAYIIEWSGLGIVDVSDPADPHYLNYYSGPNDVYLSGNHAYCATWSGMIVLDISDPSAPFLAGSAYEGTEYSITLLDSTAYCLVIDGLSVFDVSEPLLPFKISEYPMLTDVMRVKIDGDVAVASSWDNPAVGTINIAEPPDPFGLGTYDIDHHYDCWTPELAVQGNYTYVAARDSGLRVLDISEPTNIVEIGRCMLPGSLTPIVRNVFVQGAHAYLAAGYDYAFAVINIAVPNNPYVVSGIPFGDTLQIYDIFVVGNYAYCATRDGLQIIDVADPYNPHSVAECSVSTQCDAVFISGSYAYLDDHSNLCLWIIDISNPHSPFTVGQYPDINIEGVFAVGNYLFLGSQTFGDGLRILDISDPSNYDLVGYYRTPFIWIDDVVVVNDYVYLSTFDMGMLILQYYGLGINEKDKGLCYGNIYLNTIGNNIRYSYELDNVSRIAVSLIDVSGRIISKDVINETAGLHTRVIENTNIPTGIYFLRIETNEWSATRKVVLLR